MTFTAVGSLQNAENSVAATSTTFALTTTTPGDFVLASLQNGDTGVTGKQTSNVTSTLCTWVNLVLTGPLNTDFFGSVWLGTVNSAGSDTVTVTYASSMGGANSRFDAHEFASSAGNVALDTSGTISVPGGTNTWATLTPSGVGRLYWGWGEDDGAASAGSTSGFTYLVDSHSNGAGYCLSVSAAYTPVWGDSGFSSGTMVLLSEGGPAAVKSQMQAQVPVYYQQRVR